MKYIIRERDFHYIPEPEDAGYDFDECVFTREIETEVDTLNEALEKCTAFASVFQEVEAVSWFDDFVIELLSNTGSDKRTHPDYFYTERHKLEVKAEKKLG